MRVSSWSSSRCCRTRSTWRAGLDQGHGQVGAPRPLYEVTDLLQRDSTHQLRCGIINQNEEVVGSIHLVWQLVVATECEVRRVVGKQNGGPTCFRGRVDMRIVPVLSGV